MFNKKNCDPLQLHGVVVILNAYCNALDCNGIFGENALISKVMWYYY